MARPIVTKARILRGEYVRIDHTEGEMHVLLAEGKTTQQSLIDSAAEMREKARRLLRQANLIDQARALL